MWCLSYPCDVIPLTLMKSKSEAPWSAVSFSLPFVTFSQEQYSFLNIILKPPPFVGSREVSHSSHTKDDFITLKGSTVFQGAVGPYYLSVAQKGETSLKIALFTLFNVSCVPQCSCNGKLYCTLQDFSVSYE